MTDREAMARDLVWSILENFGHETAHLMPDDNRDSEWEEAFRAVERYAQVEATRHLDLAYQGGRREGLEEAAKKLERCGCVHTACTEETAEAIRALAEGEK
jgi:hypothetical protein